MAAYVLSDAARQAVQMAAREAAEKLASDSRYGAAFRTLIAKPAVQPSNANDWEGEPGVLVTIAAPRNEAMSAKVTLYRFGEAKSATTATDSLGNLALDILEQRVDFWGAGLALTEVVRS